MQGTERFFTMGLRNDVHPMMLRKKTRNQNHQTNSNSKSKSNFNQRGAARAGGTPIGASPGYDEFGTPPQPYSNAKEFIIHSDCGGDELSQAVTESKANTATDSKIAS